MTAEGRLARGKANYESKKFLDNSETLAYIATLPKEAPKVEPKEKPKEAPKKDKEAKDATPTK